MAKALEYAVCQLKSEYTLLLLIKVDLRSECLPILKRLRTSHKSDCKAPSCEILKLSNLSPKLR